MVGARSRLVGMMTFILLLKFFLDKIKIVSKDWMEQSLRFEWMQQGPMAQTAQVSPPWAPIPFPPPAPMVQPTSSSCLLPRAPSSPAGFGNDLISLTEFDRAF